MKRRARRKHEDHPLFNTWRSATRSARHPSGIDPRWRDFLTFASDVGDRPSPDHRLYRRNRDRPYGPDNFEWKLCIPDQVRSRYMKEWRERNSRHWRSKHLKRYYGISLDEYEVVLAKQNGLCAICLGPETLIGRDGKPYALAVDHCHATGRVRGLLCKSCNTMLGDSRDNPVTLRRAADYLERHR